MLATLTIEIAFAIYIVWRYKMTVITRLIVVILGLLALFQGTEFLLCGGLALQGGVWSRIGYGAITLLPALGLHLTYKLANKKASWMVAASYVSAAAFVGYFVFASQAISGHTCYANYATFDTASGSSTLYGLYYYGWLFVSLFSAVKWAPELEKHRRAALFALVAGYLGFIVPTTTINIIDQSTVGGIPSIMCGFAVILAFVLVGKIAPEVNR